MGNHNFFVTVLDAAGNPLSGVTIEVFWDGAGSPLRGISGSKSPGRMEVAVGAGAYHLRVSNDASAGRPVRSQDSRLMRTGDWPESEWEEVKQAGYAIDNRFYCHGHYSWDVEIKRTW